MKTEQDFNSFYQNKTVSELFEQCVATHGDKIALCSYDGNLTYNELNAKANILANYLRQCGVQPNTLIAVYLERSLEFIIATLAIIKAGGAYVPLDVDIPLNRNLTILLDSDPYKIIANSENSQTLHNAPLDEEVKNKIIEINTIFTENLQIDNQNPTCLNNPDDLIYVMYTSGSTGSPKGCMIPHSGVVGLIKNLGDMAISTTDCVAHVLNITFDPTTFEIWGALLSGATLAIAPKNIFYDVALFQTFLAENYITILVLTASIFHVLAEKEPAIFNSLRYLLVGGDIIYSASINKVLKQSPNNLIINGYGPTECTALSTFYPMQSLSDIRDPVPIGKPLTGKAYLILDENLKPVLANEVGELCIAGIGLAKGYWNQPELTEEKFILYHDNTGHELRLYRSGDLVRLLPDGNLQFLGRKDRQVKIRGYRVNLDEVETCIVKFPAVNQVAVIAEKSIKTGLYLVAYVSFQQLIENVFFKFRQFLKENLPNYMIPAKIICVHDLPLTNNGKIDRKILNQLEGQVILTNDEKPANSLEKSITEILVQLLETPDISVTENFFDLGADSLILGEMCIALNAQLGKERKLGIADIFAHPTTRLLAQYIAATEDTQLKTLKNDFERAALQRHRLIRKRGKHELVRGE